MYERKLSEKSEISEFERFHQDSYFDDSKIGFCFPEVPEEVPEEETILITPEQREYFIRCQKFISEERFKPSDEEKVIVEEICRKKSSDTPVEPLIEEELIIYKKYSSRFLWSGYDSRKMFFREKITPIEFPEDEYDEERFSIMLRHYFTSREIEQIRELVEVFQDIEKPDPDMSDRSFTITVAIAHLLKIQTISDIDTIFTFSDIGQSSCIEGGDFDTKFRSRYYLKCDDDFEYGDISRTSCDTRYFVTYENIPIEHLPPTKELFMIETMAFDTKFKFSIDCQTSFSFEEALEGHYFDDDFIDSYYKPFIIRKFK